MVTFNCTELHCQTMTPELCIKRQIISTEGKNRCFLLCANCKQGVKIKTTHKRMTRVIESGLMARKKTRPGKHKKGLFNESN